MEAIARREDQGSNFGWEAHLLLDWRPLKVEERRKPMEIRVFPPFVNPIILPATGNQCLFARHFKPR
jgi:hypothetical protein